MAELLTPPRDRLMPIKRESLPAAMPAAIASPGYSASLSADQQTITDVLSQVYRGTSVVRMAPLPPSANAAANAAANSAAQVIVNQTPSTPSTPVVSGVSSVELDMPPQFAVSGSPGTGVVDLGVAWTAEPPSTFLGSPGPGLTGLQVIAQTSGNGLAGSTLSVTGTPQTASTFGLFVGSSNANVSTPAGWTDVNGSGSFFDVAYNTLSGTSPITVSESLIGTDISWSASLTIFNGPSPTFVQMKTGATQSAALAYTSNNTAGNTLFIVMQWSTVAAGGYSYAPIVFDSNNNTYQLISVVFSGSVGVSGENLAQYVYVAPNCIGGANTVHYSFTGSGFGTPRFSAVAFEMSPLAAGPGLPIFRVLSSADIPPINLGTNGPGGVAGILGVQDGGTGSSLLATGGANQVLQQTSSGAAVTVGQLDFPSLAGAAGQFPTHYNGVATVSNGLPSEIIKSDLTAQNAAITATTLISAPQTGMYRVSWSATITTADGVSSSLGGTNGFQVVYTSPTDSVAKTTAPQTPWATGLNTTGTADGGVMVVYAKTGTNIQYAYDYTSATPGQMKYELHIKLEAL